VDRFAIAAPQPATDRAGSLRAIFGVNLTILAKRTFAAHATFPE
jgi:hypothetical protein